MPQDAQRDFCFYQSTFDTFTGLPCDILEYFLRILSFRNLWHLVVPQAVAVYEECHTISLDHLSHTPASVTMC